MAAGGLIIVALLIHGRAVQRNRLLCLHVCAVKRRRATNIFLNIDVGTILSSLECLMQSLVGGIFGSRFRRTAPAPYSTRGTILQVREG